ncbi:MAG: multidrug transporter MatE, partial [Liquorilactobacillus sp.]
YFKDYKKLTFLIILHQILLQVPLALLLPLNYGIFGLWSSYYSSDILACIVIGILLINQHHKLSLE